MKNRLYKALAFIKKDFIVESSYKMAFLIMIFNSSMPIFSYFFLGKLVHSDSLIQKYNASYFAYVFVGIGFTTYFQIAITTFADSIRRAQMAGCLEAIISSRTGPKTIVLFSSFFSFISAFFQLFAMYLVACIVFGLRLPNANWSAFVIVFICSLLTFMSLGLLAAVGTVLFKKGEPFGFLFGALSSILGGAYFPVEIMPDWLRYASYCFPISYALEALRQTLLNGASIEGVFNHLIILSLICLIIFPLSLVSFEKAIEIGKKEGSLLQY